MADLDSPGFEANTFVNTKLSEVAISVIFHMEGSKPMSAPDTEHCKRKMEKGRGGICCGPLGWLVGFRLNAIVNTLGSLLQSKVLPQQGSVRFCKGFP